MTVADDAPLRTGDAAVEPAGPPALPAQPLLEHLRELRQRLIYSVLALAGGAALGFPLSLRAIQGLKTMCTSCDPSSFQIINPLDGFTTYFRVSLILGLVVAMPIILYQVVAFIVPALYARERRILYLMLPGAAVLFATGMVFGFFIVMPRTLDFLVTVSAQLAKPQLNIVTFINFATNLLFILGLAFQTPLVVFTLAKIGILRPETMSRYRRHAIMTIAIISAILTPTPDPWTMLMVMVPMYLLYEAGGLLARIF